MARKGYDTGSKSGKVSSPPALHSGNSYMETPLLVYIQYLFQPNFKSSIQIKFTWYTGAIKYDYLINSEAELCRLLWE